MGGGTVDGLPAPLVQALQLVLVVDEPLLRVRDLSDLIILVDE